ncbi:MAG: family 20 glycosylhydrolase [Gemmatimonadota bacterium]
MKALLLALLLPTTLWAQTPADRLIPAVSHAAALPGSWRIPDTLTVAWNSRRASPAEALLRDIAQRPVRHATTSPAIRLRLGTGPATDESYTLRVAPEGVVIAAPSIAGLRWGVQTLRALMPAAGAATIPAVEIRDAPRYAWRGAMLDVSRHFFLVPDILRWIDAMARLKLNVFHWHLTDDQGWRLAIAKYPDLVAVGGFRAEPDGSRYGGFYSKADVQRVVTYAALRGITVVPEIEMPGHARAALAAYPALGCTGKALPVPNGWGVFDDVLCPTEPTFRFLEAVLSEVIALFPSPYVHIGGDEVPKTRWKECAACQATIAREKLGQEEGLQRWFTARIATWLAAHGRRMIGWDEILNGGAPAGAIVQAWQGSDRIAVAQKAGAEVIASPSEWVYINRSAKELPLSRVLQFSPGPGVLGGEAPLWTENVTSAVNAELMLFPRLAGFADAMWRGPTDSSEFAPRLAQLVPQLAASGIVVGPENRDLPSAVIRYDTTAHELRADLANPISGAAIVRIAIDEGGYSETNSLAFGGAERVVVHATFHDAAIGPPHFVRLVDHLARGKPVSLATPADPRYPGTGSYTLSDGARGSDFHDGLWNGWLGADLDARIDLGKVTPIATVALSLLEDVRSWILYPTSVTVELSDDGATWRAGGTTAIQVPTTPEGRSLKVVTVTMPSGASARYVRVVAKNGGRLPAWHPGAGEVSWVFADEVIVR